MRIGELAENCSVTTDTIRFYEKKGLIKSLRNPDNGYRTYSSSDIKKMMFIKHCKQAGFSLEDIRDLLLIWENKMDASCEDVKTLAEERLHKVEVMLSSLQTVHGILHTLVQSCCGGKESAEHCSILSAIEKGE
ncbi:Zn(2+)-responsive transcriptional regulator [Algicola sagamiensis]|uniref:Zn(2+)-responsive transcriptional regulator n=1 Tax=Algicola sagamiensis TaxID=163869 RepID=UPI0006889B62|nr:Zn(2+)-responsive transcriptional regulator [Algicola sagamiensis]